MPGGYLSHVDSHMHVQQSSVRLRHSRACCPTQILERGQEISKRDWRLARVAIVDLQQQTYIGRLFFGDADSGAVVWDCDCRPSDGCWLALKVPALCPMP